LFSLSLQDGILTIKGEKKLRRSNRPRPFPGAPLVGGKELMRSTFSRSSADSLL